jgi:hypothetical protein
MKSPYEESHNFKDHQRILRDLDTKHQDILDGFRGVLEKHGIKGVDISHFGLMLKSGAPLCPDGKPAKFRCALNANGEYQCKWICE